MIQPAGLLSLLTPMDDRDVASPEVSMVMPCLNEADTLAACISKAQRALDEHDIDGEIIVADNGSTDGSQSIAFSLGARVVSVADRGYGNALMGGIEAARGRYIIMGDSDDSYDFGEIRQFVEKLRRGYDLVQGCRLPSGGGKILPGAMPRLHRWCGNPLFTFIARWWFQAPVNDVYCGMRGFSRSLYSKLDLRSGGMEFATEMIIKAARLQASIAEVPITLHPDGRKSHPPHLRTFRDGWRTLRFFLMYSPRWLFLVPGELLILLGIIGYVLALPALNVGGVNFGLNTLMFASLAIVCGLQAILFGIGTKTLAITSGMLPPDDRLRRFFKHATLERGLACGVGAVAVGLGMLGVVVRSWLESHFGTLNYELSMRWAIPGATMLACGVQTILSSFFISIIGNLEFPGRRRATTA
jgi:glycosyltransferase involved in cell wall biosynthesis